jgi:hypothetical protein
MSHTSSSSPPNEKPEPGDSVTDNDETQIAGGKKGGDSSDEKGAEEHSKGFALAMVVTALVLSVFLVALDMVF